MESMYFNQILFSTKSGQKIFVLVHSPKFQEKIKAFRKEHGLPPGGFKSNEESKTWHKKFSVDNDRAVDKIDKQTGRKDYAEVPINKYNNDMQALLAKYRLPTVHKSCIETYIKFNKTEVGKPITVSWKYNKRLDRRELFIQIFSDTVLKDVKRVWPDIIWLKKYLVGHKAKSRSRSITNLAVEQRAYELHSKNKKIKETTEILEEEGHGAFTGEYVAKLIRRFKKRIAKADP